MEIKPVKIRGRVKNGVANMKCLMPHPMETGTRKDTAGEFIPANFIETVICTYDGLEVITAEWGQSVSKDPYFAFKVKNAESGKAIKVSWTDNLGQTSSGEMVLK
jgi:sulfur-oxidizing protein SoxZ